MCIFQLDNKKHAKRRTLFENGEMAVTLPTAALSPQFKALGCVPVALDYSVSKLHIFFYGSTSVFSAPLNSATVSLDKMSEGFL